MLEADPFNQGDNYSRTNIDFSVTGTGTGTGKILTNHGSTANQHRRDSTSAEHQDQTGSLS